MNKNILILFLIFFIYSCGGGGGGGNSTPPTPPTPPSTPPPDPTLTFEATNNSIANRGGKSTLSWTSNNTNTCTASGSWEGAKTLNGEEIIYLNMSGDYEYTLSCSGNGGTISSSVQINSFNCPLLKPLEKPQLAVDSYGSACLLEADSITCFGTPHSWVYTEESNSNYLLNKPPELKDPVMISGSRNQFCALDDHGIKCWGSPISGDFDLAEVPNLSCPTFIDVDDDRVCSIDDNGISCWGNIGEDASRDEYISDAINSLSLRNPYLLELTGDFICVVDDDGIKCDGGDAYTQQSGNGTEILIATIPNNIVRDITDISGKQRSPNDVIFNVIGTAINDDDLYKQETRVWGGSGGSISYHASDVPDQRSNQILVSWGFKNRCITTGCVNQGARYESHDGTPKNAVRYILNPISGGMSSGDTICAIHKEHCNNYKTHFYSRSYGNFSAESCNSYPITSERERGTEGADAVRSFPQSANSSSITSDKNALSCFSDVSDPTIGYSKWGKGAASGIPRILDGKSSLVGYRKVIDYRCKYGIDPTVNIAGGPAYEACIGLSEYGYIGATEWYDTGQVEPVNGMLSIVQNPITVSTNENVTCLLQSKVLIQDLVVKIVEPEVPAIECWGDTQDQQNSIFTWVIPYWDNGKWKESLTNQYLN